MSNRTDSLPLLSPKESQQRQLRALALQKIDSEIEHILSLNHSQQEQYADFARQLALIEQQYRTQNSQLRQEVAFLREKCDQLERLYLATKDQLVASVTLVEQMQCAKLAKEKEIVKLKLMVRNQEGLFDEYKKNLVEEMDLERELMTATLEEQRKKMEKQFNHALLQMEKAHQEKLKKLSKEMKAKEYHSECQQLKRYLQSNKQNLHEKTMKKSNSYAKKLASEYSTTDNQPKNSVNSTAIRHNQAVFLLP